MSIENSCLALSNVGHTKKPQFFNKSQQSKQFTTNILLMFCLFFIFALISGGKAYAIDLINGGVVAASISAAGEKDSYTFSAAAGETVNLSVGDTSNNSFYPLVELFEPGGTRITYGSGQVAGAIISQALTQNGVYTVVVSDYYAAATGNYNLHFAKAPGANEGGALPNGGLKSDTIDVGDLDSYTFTASAGETVNIQVGDTSNSSFYPLVQLYGPTGARITYGTGQVAGAIISQALTQNGVYTVVVSDYYATYTGNYNLHFAKAPGANELGTLGNGSFRSEIIDTADLDSYSVSVVGGGSLQLTMTDTSNSSFYPLIQLYGPTGARITYGSGPITATITASALAAGTYKVVVSDYYASYTGNYTLSLTGTGITSVDNTKQIPLPGFVLWLLGAGLALVSIRLGHNRKTKTKKGTI